MRKQRVLVNVDWLEARISGLWPWVDTVDIAQQIRASEALVANALARMRDRGDPRLRSVARYVSR